MGKVIQISGFVTCKRPAEEAYESLFVNEEILAEVLEPIIDGKQVSVCYWICEVEMSQEEANEAYSFMLFGGKAFATYSVVYSEITGYLWTDQECTIGGHDLLKELESAVGRYLILEIEVHD